MFKRKVKVNHEPCTIVYLTYSFDINVRDMRRDRPLAKFLGTTMLPGYRLMFRGQAGHYALATIEKEEGSSVPVVLWHIPASYEAILDSRCAPLYSKTELVVMFEGKPISCITYVIDSSYPLKAPSIEYLKALICRYVYLKFCIYPLRQAYEDSMQAYLTSCSE